MKEDRIHLSENAKAHIQAQLGMGSYADASDYLESLIREDRLTREQLGDILVNRHEELQQLAIEGLAGKPITVDAKYWAAKRRKLNNEAG